MKQSNASVMKDAMSGWASVKKLAKKVSTKGKTLAVTALVMLGASTSQAALVTLDGSTGMPIFDAGSVFSPMITTIVGIVGAAAAIWVTLAGVGFIKRFMRG